MYDPQNYWLTLSLKLPPLPPLDDEYCRKVRRECEELVERGILDDN